MPFVPVGLSLQQKRMSFVNTNVHCLQIYFITYQNDIFKYDVSIWNVHEQFNPRINTGHAWQTSPSSCEVSGQQTK